MHVGVSLVRFRLPEAATLKDKRRVIKSITARVCNRFNVAIAEVDDNDFRQIVSLGIACVSNDNRHVNEVLSKVVDFINQSRFEIELLNYEIEIIPVF
ncbi:MAG: DUF503 domain-containing protein [Chloroflexi bacterium]|nr:DUF503 domain-containing protein [Chloroflexota bacterium]